MVLESIKFVEILINSTSSKIIFNSLYVTKVFEWHLGRRVFSGFHSGIRRYCKVEITCSKQQHCNGPSEITVQLRIRKI